MVFDLELDEFTGEKYDFCIVGAGAAGIVLALELLKSGKRILLVESGTNLHEPKTQDLYSSEVVGQKHSGIHEGRFRVFGGTTTKWGGQILELFKHDFSGWPVSKEQLKSYYLRALVHEGLGNVTLEDDEVWAEVGMEPPDLGPQLFTYFSRWCPNPNFAEVHGKYLRDHPNLQICLHSNARQLILSEDGASIEALLARALNGREARLHAAHYIFCLGGIESCRFLLQPGLGALPPWQLNGLLGRHFQDHLDVEVADIVEFDRKFSSYFDNIYRRGFTYQPRFTSTDQKDDGHRLTAAGCICFSTALPVSVKTTAKKLLSKYPYLVTADELSSLVFNLPVLYKAAYRYKIQGRAYNPLSGKVRLGVSCEQDPAGRSKITLSSTRDSIGMLRTQIEWQISDLELATIQKFAVKVREEFEKKNIARVILDKDLFNDADRLRSRVSDASHHMGGVRMSSSPDTGIVDPNLKIHGMTNMYICSSATFPSSGFSNPTHTLLALAIRLADHLKTL